MDGCIETNPIPDLSDVPRDGYARMHAMLDMYRQEVRVLILAGAST
jgi:carotenoid cleavage dioxygenase